MKKSQRLGLKKITEFFPKKKTCGFVALEVFTTVLIVIALGLFALAWRIHASPLDVDFAKDTIEAQLKDEASGLYGRANKLALHWPDLSGPVYLWADDVRVLNRDDQNVLSMDKIALSFSLSKLILGKIYPTVLIVKEPEFSVLRDGNGRFDVGFESLSLSESLGQGQSDVSPAARLIGLMFRDDDSSARQSLSALKVLDIQDAKVSYQDDFEDKSFVFQPVDFRVAKTDGHLYLAADVTLEDERGADQAAQISSNILIPRSADDLRLKANAKNLDVQILSRYVKGVSSLQGVSGDFDFELSGVLDGHFVPSRLDVRVRSEKGRVVDADAYPDGLEYSDLDVQAEYDYLQKILILKDARAGIAGVPLALSADLVLEDDEVNGPVHVSISGMTHDQVREVWPKNKQSGGAYEWSHKKTSGGVLQDLFAGFFFRAVKGDAGWTSALEDLKAGFDFSGARIDYRKPMIPVTQAKGQLRFDKEQEKITVVAQSGKLGGLDIRHADLIVTDVLEKGKGDADLEIKFEGPLPDVFRCLEAEPVAVQHPFDLKAVRGRSVLDLQMQFPTRKGIKVDDMKITASGQIVDPVLPGVLKGMVLNGGPFDVSIQKNLLSVNGSGRLDEQAVRVKYQSYLKSRDRPFKSKVEASLVADPVFRERLNIDVSGFVAGDVPVDVVYTDFGGGRSVADVEMDLSLARFFVEPFAYEKAVGVEAKGALRAVFQNKNITEVKSLSVEAPGAVVRDGYLSFRDGKVAGGKIPVYQIHKNRGNIEFEIEPSGLQKIVVGGAYLDLQPFLQDKGDKDLKYDEPARYISVSADVMQTDEDQAIQKGKIYLEIDGRGVINQMEMDAVAGAGDIYLRFKVDGSGKRTFRLEADDAGETLRAFGLYRNIRGGKMVIYGEPIRGIYDRNLSGTAQITNFKVRKAPGLAKLLGAMSLPGILQLLNDDGLVFTKMETRFNWLYRLNGSMIVLEDGRTSGNSVGLTFDGKIDQSVGEIDLSGTVVPLSGINEAISSIPVIGDILSGGTRSVFAATYTIKGETKDPKVVVNPLAALTPGLLRRILFEK